jgi:MbtH protein
MTDAKDESADWLVLVNDEDQHSLWSRSLAVPDGWTVVHGPATHADSLAYVERSWTDMTPRSVRLARREPAG